MVKADESLRKKRVFERDETDPGSGLEGGERTLHQPKPFRKHGRHNRFQGGVMNGPDLAGADIHSLLRSFLRARLLARGQAQYLLDSEGEAFLK